MPRGDSALVGPTAHKDGGPPPSYGENASSPPPPICRALMGVPTCPTCQGMSRVRLPYRSGGLCGRPSQCNGCFGGLLSPGSGGWGGSPFSVDTVMVGFPYPWVRGLVGSPLMPGAAGVPAVPRYLWGPLYGRGLWGAPPYARY